MFVRRRTAYEVRISAWSPHVCAPDQNTKADKAADNLQREPYLKCTLGIAPPDQQRDGNGVDDAARINGQSAIKALNEGVADLVRHIGSGLEKPSRATALRGAEGYVLFSHGTSSISNIMQPPESSVITTHSPRNANYPLTPCC